MAELPEAYKGLVLPPNYDPVRTNHRIAGLFGGLEWYFKGSGLLCVCASFFDPIYLIGGGLGLGISCYFRYEKNKTLDASDNAEAEREVYHEARERKMIDDLEIDLSDKLA